jgi:serine/threonine protein kinase
MYIILSGFLPFSGTTPESVFKQVKEADYTFDHKEFESISQDAKDLISHLLEKDIKKRYTCSQALDHAWFTQHNNERVVLDKNVVESLKNYNGQSCLKKEAMNVLVKMLNNNEIYHLKKQFE